MKRTQLALFETGEDLPIFSEPDGGRPTYKIAEAHWSGRGRDGFAVIEERPGKPPFKVGTFPTRSAAEWLLRRCEASA